jgi:hypothetical protein
MPYKAPQVDQAAYGIWGPASAQATMNPAGVDGIAALVARMKAKKEQRDYEAALAAANENQLRGSQAEAEAALNLEYLKQLKPLAEMGLVGATNVPGTNITVDPSRAALVDATQIDNTQSQSYLRNAQGLGELATKLDVRPSIDYISQQLAPPGQEDVVPIEKYINSENIAKQVAANASMKNADTNRMEYLKPHKTGSSGSGSKVKISVERDPISGDYTYKITGAGSVEEAKKLAEQAGIAANPGSADRDEVGAAKVRAKPGAPGFYQKYDPTTNAWIDIPRR